MTSSKHLTAIFGLLLALAMSATLGFGQNSQADENPATQGAEKPQFPAVAQDTKRRQFVMFGGYDNGPYSYDTWVWNGEWQEQTPKTHPLPRAWAAMAFDADHDEAVLFGGRQEHSELTQTTSSVVLRTFAAGGGRETEAVFRDTWVWNGEDWAQLHPATSPPQRYLHAMAYDAARKQVVLFGGHDGQNFLNDTWVWDGSAWTRMNPATVPPARMWHSMAYDPVHQQIVLFGGRDAMAQDFDDTWIWDGGNWTKVPSSADGPAPRMAAGMDFDQRRRSVILISGSSKELAQTPDAAYDCWSWDGQGWSRESAQQFDFLFSASLLSPSQARRAMVVTANNQLAYWVPRPAASSVGK